MLSGYEDDENKDLWLINLNRGVSKKLLKE